MRVEGIIQGRRFHVLINNNSTHNFVNFKSAKKLGSCKMASSSFRVSVANGHWLPYNDRYPSILMDVQGYQFITTLYSLDLQGSNIVLGMQWLRSLGSVIHDWDKLTMEFSSVGRDYFIQGEAPGKLQHSSIHSMQCLVASGVEAFLMQLIETTNVEAEPTQELSQVAVLEKFFERY
jgi:hypothetical protein